MNNAIELKGITWAHSRGYTPLVACAQRFHELHPSIHITWDTRSLQAFADFPIEKLVYDYDLLVIDHPWVGCAAATACVLPLDKYLPEDFLADQLRHSVGDSHLSYFYNQHQWALALDAATPVASYRKDLFEKNGITVPETWADVLQLAGEGRVALPGIPIDLLMHFYSCCIAAGQAPFQNKQVTDYTTGIAALQMMQSLWSRVDEKMFSCNPIAVAEMMTTSDLYWYCPFAYGYSNYARPGYAAQPLHYTDVVQMPAGKGRFQTTLGGTGLAVSSFCRNIDAAIRFAQWLTSSKIQQSIYTQNGGQPAHLSAWLNQLNNCNAANYFTETLPALQRAYTRPRYHGYLAFQDQAGWPIQAFLQNRKDARAVIDEINQLYQTSIIAHTPIS